ncbi:MAG: triose-phosphate isomerase, partial [Lactobacillus iners]
QAEEMCKTIRETVKDLYVEATSDIMRIQYGGYVKPANVKELMAKPNIDGGLVGGASLDPESFLALVNYQD